MSEVNNVGLNAFLAQQYAPKQSDKIATPASTEKVKSEPSIPEHQAASFFT